MDGLLPRVELTSLLEDLRIPFGRPGRAGLRAAVAGLGPKAGGTWSVAPGTAGPMTPIITFTTACGGARIERLETRPAGCMAAMAEIPSNRRRWALPAALVVVGVLMMVIASFRPGDYGSATWLQLGSALALFGPLYGAQRMLERRSPSESPGSSL